MKFRVFAQTTNPKVILRDAERYVRQLGDAALYASDVAAAEAQKKIRADMAGRKLSRLRGIVRQTSDKKKGRRPRTGLDQKWRAGSVVFRRTDGSPRAAGAWEAYTKGPVIIPKRGRWLAFPTANVPKRAGRRKMTPALYRSAGFEGKTGPLQFIKGPTPGVAYLIAKDVTVGGGNRSGPASRSRRGGRVRREFVVMFILIRRTKRDVRFRPIERVKAESARIPQIMETYLNNRQRRGVNRQFTRPVGSTVGSGGGRLGNSF